MIRYVVCAFTVAVAPAAFAQSPSNPPPPIPAPTAMAATFLQIAGEADVYEVTSSEIALKRASALAVKQFAAMLIEHHTNTTNTVLAQAAAANLVVPPAVLGLSQREMLDELYASTPSDFDQRYLAQQIAAHEQALLVQQFYAASGDTPALKSAAASAVPIIERHLEQARRLATR